MELLVFGHSGISVLFFPTRKGRFYELENRGIIDALRTKIENGYLQVFCIDSIDNESFYSQNNPSHKVVRHLQYENYILNEVLPFIHNENNSDYIIAAGCSMGAYHAVNIGLRHPDVFNKLLGMSGRYDLCQNLDHYEDLLEGYWDENVYFNMPSQFIPNLSDDKTLGFMKKQEIVLAVGRQDVFYQNNCDLNHNLWEKGVNSQLYAWDYEAHSASFWRKMVDCYL